MPIRCEIVTQDKSLFEGPADVVIAPGVEGELGILPNHAPLLTNLDFGLLCVRYRGEEDIFTIAGGILEVRPDLVTVLADVGERIDEIDLTRAEEAKERAERYLKEGPPPDTDEYLRIQAALQRSKLRIEAASRYRRRSRPSTVQERSDEGA
ncbi:MAG: ATP synthase F1 subunit epsilon [Anaerolineales bacterium]|nr:ATP synthase F1 subunit epsilon [Anaerolineales bacterium]